LATNARNVPHVDYTIKANARTGYKEEEILKELQKPFSTKVCQLEKLHQLLFGNW